MHWAKSARADGSHSVSRARTTDARSSAQELRRQLIEDHAVDAVVAVGPNMFYTVTLPVTLWFLDRDKKRRRVLISFALRTRRHAFRAPFPPPCG